MKYLIWMFVLCPLAFASPCPTGQAKDEATLGQIEQAWARSLEKQDVAALGCILGDEFEDADPSGAVTGRAATLEKAAKGPGSHHELSDLHAHILGDTGYIRGVAQAMAPDGKIKAKVRFTDIYVYRDGRWQCVAGHESLFPKQP
ncbi:MAG TPA: nuclear transport factor 2 family protein [Candidatus Solibacter sp.]|nr:nuclear transport factor 2 family protein [Candidatus Solibacter sp.]